MANPKKFKSISRRNLIKVTGVGALVAGFGTKLILPDTAIATDVVSTTPSITTYQALQMLMDGNKRHVAFKELHPHQTEQRLKAVAKGQHPFAIILGCSDSRVPPEIAFDQELGDLFVIRVAGNIVDDAVAGSIEFAAAQIGVPLVMVLGHQKCGAVTAALKGERVPGHISTLVQAILPAVAKAKGQPGEALDNAVKANVKMVVEELKTSTPILANLVQQKKLTIVGGCYNLDTGEVTIIA